MRKTEYGIVLLAILVTMCSLPLLPVSAASPQVYNVDSIMFQKFANTGWTPQSTSPFYLPPQGQVTGGVTLKIEGKSYGDQYPSGTPIARYLQVYINDQKIWSDNNWNGKIVSGSFSFSQDITSKAKWWDDISYTMNTAKVTLTTYVGYWVVRAHICVVYSANEHFRQYSSQYANWYWFENTGYNVISFPAQLPESIVNVASGAVITIHAKDYGDGYPRYLDLYIDGQKLNRWTIQTEATKTMDITSYLLGKSSTTVGIVITTWVGHWIVDGDIKIKYRPAVAPDSSNYWKIGEHVVTQRAGNMYDDNFEKNAWCGLFSVETKTKEGQTQPTFYTGVTASVPNAHRNDHFIEEIDVHISAKHKYATTPIDSSRYLNLQKWKGSESGQDMKGIGTDLLNVLAAGLTFATAPYAPEISLLAAIAPVLVKYVTTTDFTFGPETNGIHLNWWTYSYLAGAEETVLGIYAINWPEAGEYTVTIQTTIKGWFYFPQGIWWSATASFTDTFLYYNV